jgi:hypothetical protein
VLQRAVLEKKKRPPSSSTFCAPVATLHTLIVQSSLPETNVSASTYSTFVTDLLKNKFFSVSSGPQSKDDLYKARNKSKYVFSLLTLKKEN